MKKIEIRQKLLASIEEDKESGCWVWKKFRNRDGYGMMRIGGKKGFVERVHRLSAFVFMEFDLESGLCVLHSCDNPACINPDHLFIGTQQDNVRDMVEKGRNKALSGKDHPWYGRHHSENAKRKISAALYGRQGSNVGSRNGMAKLTEEDVKKIRRLHASGRYYHRELAEMFGVSRATIGAVLSGRLWNHVKE